MVYLVVRQPFTYHLLLLSDHLTGVRASLAEELNMSVLAGGAFSLMVLTAVAISLVRLAPSFLKQMSRAFHSRWGLVVTLIYLVAAHAWAVRELRDPTAAANPQLALVSSLFNFKGAAYQASNRFPAADLDDFLPRGADRRANTNVPALVSFSPALAHRPLNVLMVVMESVGAHQLEPLWSTFRRHTGDDSSCPTWPAFPPHVRAPGVNLGGDGRALFVAVSVPRLVFDFEPVPEFGHSKPSRGAC